jgi:hypothetical protein
MTAAISRNRRRAATEQRFRCYYCGLPVWEQDPERFAARYRLTERQLPLLRCTAEHLHALQDGGGSGSSNIVAACWYCNSHRHRSRVPMPPRQYRAWVRKRMRQGRWLVAILPGFVAGAGAGPEVRA